MSRILVGYVINGHAGGIDQYLLNFLHAMSNSHNQIDFLTTKMDQVLKSQLEDFGSCLYEIPSLKHPIRQYRRMCEIFSHNTYDIAYFNISTSLNGIGVLAAKRCSVPRRILHSHSSGIDCSNTLQRNLLTLFNRVGRIFLYKFGTEFFACSCQAGEWLFPEKVIHSACFHIIPNVIDTEKFAFHLKTRKDYRRRLHIDHHFVLGHIGNFRYQKNHSYLLSIFHEVLRKQPDAVLLLVGDGPDMEKIKKQCLKLHLGESVIFLGRRNDIAELLQAMDSFVLPSHFEGFPIVAVEAQASGLPCFLSDRITREADLTGMVQYLSLKQPFSIWADKILQTANKDRSCYAKTVADHGFSINCYRRTISKLFGEEDIL